MTAPRPSRLGLCAGCGRTFSPRRAGHTTCSARCRQRVHRQRASEEAEDPREQMTPEERAALQADVQGFLARHGHGHWLRDPITPEQVRAHVIATVERS